MFSRFSSRDASRRRAGSSLKRSNSDKEVRLADLAGEIFIRARITLIALVMEVNDFWVVISVRGCPRFISLILCVLPYHEQLGAD